MLKFKLYFESSKDTNLLLAFIEPSAENFALICEKLNIALHDLGPRGTLDRILYISRHELGLSNLNHVITVKTHLDDLVKIADSLQFKEIIIVNLGYLSLHGQLGGDLIDHARKIRRYLNKNIFRLLPGDTNEEKIGISSPLYIDLQTYKALPPDERSQLNIYFQTGRLSEEYKLSFSDHTQAPFFSILKRGYFEGLVAPHKPKVEVDGKRNVALRQNPATDNKLFFFNTESISDQHYIKTYFQHNEKIEHIYMPAAGLKIVKTVEDCFLEPKLSTITVFDYNRSLIEFKRALHLLWDGINYPLFIKKFNESNSLPYSQEEMSLHQKLWDQTLAARGGAQQFSESWRQLKKFKMKFIWIDVVTKPECFSDIVEDRPNTLIFLDCVYDYQKTLQRGSLDNMYSYLRLLKALKQKKNNSFLIGSNCFGGNDAFFIKNKEDIIPQLTDPFV
jgi:hypothetical protein